MTVSCGHLHPVSMIGWSQKPWSIVVLLFLIPRLTQFWSINPFTNGFWLYHSQLWQRMQWIFFFNLSLNYGRSQFQSKTLNCICSLNNSGLFLVLWSFFFFSPVGCWCSHQLTCSLETNVSSKFFASFLCVVFHLSSFSEFSSFPDGSFLTLRAWFSFNLSYWNLLSFLYL